MAATREDIRGWFRAGVASGATHLIVVCDTFEWEDYPVYVGGTAPGARTGDVREIAEEYRGKNMQRVMEVYNLSEAESTQVDTSARVYNW